MKYQNLILSVLLVQTIILGWLAVQLVDVRNDITQISAQNVLVDDKAMYSPASSKLPAISASGEASVNASEVRTIIRSELDAFAADVLSAVPGTMNTQIETPEKPIADLVELAGIRADVKGQLGLLHSGAGSSAVEIARLEQNIGRLPKGEREAALKQMFKAVNQGKVDVKF